MHSSARIARWRGCYAGWASLAAVTAGGCQWVAATQTLSVDPVNTANALPGYGGSIVPPSYNGRIRIADLAVTPGHVDFCVRSSGGVWGEPVMRTSGTDTFFRTGLAYPQVTVPFAVPSGKIDVKFITAGGTCAARALSEADGIEVGVAALTGDAGSAVPPPVVTIVRYGGNAEESGAGGIAESVAALAEETNLNPTCQEGCGRFRVVNAAASPDLVNVGLVDNGASALPATVSQLLFAKSIPPGHAPSSAVGAPLANTDSSGYVTSVGSGGTGLPTATLGVVAGSNEPLGTKAVAIFQPSGIADTQTLFLIGAPNDRLHPIQGLLVEDDKAASGPPDAGIDYTYLAKSVLTTPPSLTVDTFSAALYGLAAPSDDARRGPILNALATRSTDALCVVDMDFDSDKAALASAAAARNFPYAYWVPTTISTPPTLTADWYGNTPPPISKSACSAESTGALDEWAKCASQCSSGSYDSEDASVSSASCLETSCEPTAVAMSSDPTCEECLILYLLSGYPIDVAINECANDANDPYGQFEWGGANGTMLLSRLPFAKRADGVTDDTDVLVLPATNFRVVVLRARLQVGADAGVDVYCGEFVIPTEGSVFFPYTGQYAVPDAGLYADAGIGDNGWRDEDNLQARDLITWLSSESGAGPSVVAGLWYTSVAASNAAGEQVIAAFDPEVYSQLTDAGLTPAHPLNYSPECSYCGSNPYSTQATGWTGADYDGMTTFLVNFPPLSTSSDVLWDTDPGGWTITLPGVDAGPFPLSPYYPRSVTVLLP